MKTYRPPTSNDTVLRRGDFIAPVLHEIRKVIVGQDYLVNRLLLGLLCNGHLLIEGVPGLAKTLAVKTLSDTIEASFKRVQFTPDLLQGAERAPRGDAGETGEHRRDHASAR